MNTTRRFPRSAHDVWPWHGVVTYYRAPPLQRWGHVIATALTLALLAAIGVLLAWRG